MSVSSKPNLYQEGMGLLEEKFGNGKDNLVALATIAIEPGTDGEVCPVVRTVDAYYEDAAFYVVTHAQSNKIKQIEMNSNVSISCEWFTASGTGENLGWVLEPCNAEIRAKLRTAFANWYDMANNENDKNCCFLEIRLSKGTLNVNHWEKLYHMDFANETEMNNAGIF